MFKCDRNVGKCLFLAPTYNIREEAITWTLNPPNADIATKIGIIQAHFPKTKLPKV